MQKDQTCAKQNFKSYLKFYPNDTTAKQILKAIESGNLEIKESKIEE
ncbi:MAG: hypothetical protein LUC34_05135 [Campylobacter sp.]|nr:hypothetical protein [Campylobacter sp.]